MRASGYRLRVRRLRHESLEQIDRLDLPVAREPLADLYYLAHARCTPKFSLPGPAVAGAERTLDFSVQPLAELEYDRPRAPSTADHVPRVARTACARRPRS